MVVWEVVAVVRGQVMSRYVVRYRADKYMIAHSIRYMKDQEVVVETTYFH